MKKFRLFLTCLALVFSGVMSAQNIQVAGIVKDAATGEPIPYASVQVKGTRTGVNTAENGTFSLSAPANGTLVISFIGYKTQEVLIQNRSSINVDLASEAVALDNVIVVAYGTAKKESFTGSAEVVKSDAIIKRSTSTITKAIEGTVAGVQTTAGGGQPGSGVSIRIRGNGSIKASNEPLYVVDGVPYDGQISALNPNDIENMSILKDASASTLYGARGSNGVVIINTKRGKDGKKYVTFKAEFGVSSRALLNYETVSSKEYMETARALYGANFMSRLGGESYNPYDIQSTQLFDADGKIVSNAKLRWDDNWIKEAQNKAPYKQDYQLGISGGDEKTQYLFSFGYYKENGLIMNTDFDRFSAKVTVDSKFASWAKAGMSMNASTTKQNSTFDNGSYYTNVWYSALALSPIYPVYKKDSNGNTMYDASGDKIFDYGDTRPMANNSNAIGDLTYNKYLGKNDNLSGRTFIEFKTDKDIPIVKDLSLSVNLGFDYLSKNYSEYSNPLYGQYVSQGGNIEKYSYRNLTYTFNQLLTYDKTYNQHHVNLLLGHEFYKMNNYDMFASKKGFAFFGLYELSAASTVSSMPTSKIVDNRVESYLSRLNYDYADKYYFSASYRTDGSSRFYKDSRWGNFWSLGASWKISKEKFMQSLTWIDNLTYKISYGYQGNDNIGTYYGWQALYDLEYANAEFGGVFPTSVENKNLKWEKNTNLNTGIEASLFGHRLKLTVEYYIKNTGDLIMSRPMAVSTGFASYLDNVGSMENKGIDITLGGTPVQNKNFKWDITFIGSHVKNKVTKLNDGLQNLDPTNVYITKVGYPLNSFYLVMNGGADPQTGAQRYKYIDANGVEQLTTSYNTANAKRTDANIQGSRMPDFEGSLTNSFELYNFDLSCLLTYSIGGKVYDSNYFGLMETRNAGANYHMDLYNMRWKQPGDITNVPKLSENTKYHTDFYLTDASYLSIKNISLGYNFDSRFVKKLGLESLRLTMNANNLYLFSHRKGMDPQYNFNGTVDYSYTPVRTVSFGIDLKF